MADYKKMYYILFNKITNIIEELTEEIYVENDNKIIKLSIHKADKDN